ncbi:hypothetical protein D3C78_1366240 [compost metagenome]
MIAAGRKTLINSAAGTSTTLLISEPLATAQTTASSRSDCTPDTCSAFKARSSPSTPAVFPVATLVMVSTSSVMADDWRAAVLVISATSSSKAVMSSSSINKPVAAIGKVLYACHASTCARAAVQGKFPNGSSLLAPHFGKSLILPVPSPTPPRPPGRKRVCQPCPAI